MASKIMLVKPNIAVRKGFDLQSKMCPPIGLAYLAGVLLKDGHAVEIVDMVADGYGRPWPYKGTHNNFGLTNDEFLDRVRSSAPDIVGLTGFTTQHGRVVELVSIIKDTFPHIKVVLGGIHSTSMPEYMMQHSRADYLILGEGEYSFAALVDALKNNDYEAIKKIDGIVYREGEGFVLRLKTDFIKDMDAIPAPPIELFNNEVYLKDEVAMPIITSRGCPNNCSFCAIHNTQGYGWRPRGPMQVVDEIELLNKAYGYKTISFFDDAFNVKAERVIEICQEIVRRGIEVRLVVPGGLIVKRLTKETLYWLKKAGCTAVSLPFEHVDETMRNRVIKKGIAGDQFSDVLNWCREIELLALVNFVIGMPGETDESVAKINDYVKRNAFRMDAVQVLIATPFPGTAFYKECIEKNYLVNPEKNDFLDFDLYGCLIDTPTMKHGKIEQFKKMIEATFSKVRQGHFSEPYIRKAIRKPTKETDEYIKSIYFVERNLLWDRHCEG